MNLINYYFIIIIIFIRERRDGTAIVTHLLNMIIGTFSLKNVKLSYNYCNLEWLQNSV